MLWIRSLLGYNMQFKHIKILYPTAPLQPYTPLEGERSHVWFDRQSITPDAPEDRQSMEQIYDHMSELIKEEGSLGIPPNRIIFGGFSMGGALALHTGYHINTELAGVFACSAFLNRDSIVYNTLQQNPNAKNRLPELRMFHGDDDDLVHLEWGQQSFEKLKELGVKGTFTILPNTEHELKQSSLVDIKEWILKKLPE